LLVQEFHRQHLPTVVPAKLIRNTATHLIKKAGLTHPEIRLYHTPFTDWKRLGALIKPTINKPHEYFDQTGCSAPSSACFPQLRPVDYGSLCPYAITP
jgi:hypothetical protein